MMTEGARRKRSKTACLNCSKAHASCEEKRPCSRCVMRGVDDTCIDKPRKKSKYMHGINEKQILLPVPVPTYFESALGERTNEIVSSGIDLFSNHIPLVPYRNKTVNSNFLRDDKTNQYELTAKKFTFPDILDNINTESDGHDISLSLKCEESVDGPVRYYDNPLWEHSLRYRRSIDIYELVNRPLSHTPGFHHLFNYLSKRLPRDKLIQISKELSEFRPIFFECSIELTEQDLIFMEQGYQRTLLEYSKMIFKSGTPTCIWRRNGQISFINEEFEILTGWKRQQLLGKMTFIVEILDDDSVVDYFKTFSKIAYKEYKGSEVMYNCKILTSVKEAKMNCNCIWTLREDFTGLPLMIVANFMPLL
ncbi:hypothetical protein TPHA_0N01110 [Tetrapisispora phaffii CBS 4417]|uniref:Zn(2)-C6 fungal-type domain-containing protein n=1 Tax=Tetrapisispora phaffii (strain ATCC 24235 / CBS 4417 / NBRC 1672 / NRRL Y-8282 / UCD 70-5) TaxID=1071381 RepID=G8C164_TETPH|nr:hypothetical protein TPHA_0N01110 [Tetrapisispora phaffii CBS 4417]CCE65892.1 hypothetical protein TPHA_0N01110 [Tetrapisispora phaffii CBS 4417]